MATSSTSKRLSLSPPNPLTPRTHIRVLFTSWTTDSIASTTIGRLQGGLGSLSETIAWLSGQVLSYGHDDGAGTWSRDASCEALSAEDLLPDSISEHVWPVPPTIDEDLFTKGASVFGASLFRFADGQGISLCICMHHSAVDATALADIVRLWAQHTAGPPPSLREAG
ncbi:hypothetical protein F5B21DRAFT_503000 [Xylaria acuta]|nr:hypothetical protein F5B21DRAFT_503000 [Xylaria acuta]